MATRVLHAIPFYMRFAATALLFAASFLSAQQLPNADLLKQPPSPAQATNCPKIDEWSTPAEKSCYRTTPRYDETMQYLRRIASAAPKQVKIESFGRTGQGRELYAVIVSRDGQFAPESIHKANRPVFYIQNSIHAGEMDGKDASMALLRDILVTKKLASLIDRAVIVMIPMYNADGHEWFGAYNRINQNGPEQMGWRTNARQLNLNRDYMKADAPETRAFLAYWNKWLPDFFVDDHVTDGADYQYDVTYFADADPTSYAPLRSWLTDVLAPAMEKHVSSVPGHLAGPYIDFNGQTPDTGLSRGQSSPRFSTGYVNLQNRPAVLIEMHMLKDYATRVTGNYEALKAMLEVVNRDADKLVKINREADAATITAAAKSELPIRMTASAEKTALEYRGYKWTVEKSAISGADWLQYTHEPITMTIARSSTLVPTVSVKVPAAYIVPAEWTTIVDRLQAHGIQVQKTTQPWTSTVETYRCENPQWAQQPFEGRHALTWPKEVARPCRAVQEKVTFAAGSYVVPMNQRAAKVALHWLEPEAPDSAMQWGLFDSIFEQKEYGEGYVLERLARKMLESDPKLRQEFDEKVASDPQFAANSYQRLNWFYKRSPWWDPRIGLYPVGRLSSLEGVPIQ